MLDCCCDPDDSGSCLSVHDSTKEYVLHISLFNYENYGYPNSNFISIETPYSGCSKQYQILKPYGICTDIFFSSSSSMVPLILGGIIPIKRCISDPDNPMEFFTMPKVNFYSGHFRFSLSDNTIFWSHPFGTINGVEIDLYQVDKKTKKISKIQGGIGDRDFIYSLCHRDCKVCYCTDDLSSFFGAFVVNYDPPPIPFNPYNPSPYFYNPFDYICVDYYVNDILYRRSWGDLLRCVGGSQGVGWFPAQDISDCLVGGVSTYSDSGLYTCFPNGVPGLASISDYDSNAVFLNDTISFGIKMTSNGRYGNYPGFQIPDEVLQYMSFQGSIYRYNVRALELTCLIIRFSEPVAQVNVLKNVTISLAGTVCDPPEEYFW